MKINQAIGQIENYHLKEDNGLGKVVKVVDMIDNYDSIIGVSQQTELYKVEMIDVPSNNDGSYNFGITTIYPVLINGQCAMTKGHRHIDTSRDEIYYCQSGEGLLYLSNGEEHIFEKMQAGSVHYIKGEYAHRTINTGKDNLSFLAIWSPHAGYDYELNLATTFKHKVYIEDNEVTII